MAEISKLDVRRILADSDVLLTHAQRVRIAIARARRILARDFCQDPETGLLCGSEPGTGGGEGEGGGGKPASGAEAAKEVDRLSIDREGVSFEDMMSLRRYIENSNGFVINQALRGQIDNPKALKDAERFLDSYDRNALPTNKDLLLYRGIKGDAFATLKAGDTFVDKGIISTSASKKWAQRFAKGGVMIEVRVPKGTRAMGGIAGSQEMEMVLRPDSKFSVISRTTKRIVVELQ